MIILPSPAWTGQICKEGGHQKIGALPVLKSLLLTLAGFLHVRGFLQLTAGLEHRPIRGRNLNFLFRPGIVTLPGLALLDLQRTKADNGDALLLLDGLCNDLQCSRDNVCCESFGLARLLCYDGNKLTLVHKKSLFILEFTSRPVKAIIPFNIISVNILRGQSSLNRRNRFTFLVK